MIACFPNLRLIAAVCFGTWLGAQTAHAAAPAAMIVPGPEFGEELPAIPMGLGPSMDVAVSGEHVFVIGGGELKILKSDTHDKPQVLGKVSGLGNTRQLAVHEGYAYITSREDGMFVVDVRDVSKPRLAYHYDSAELATAIAVSGQVVAIGNRFAGIELLDISNPESPKFLSCIRAGEVQSLVFQGTWLYVGAWSEKEVVVIDASDPRQPVTVNHLPLDGYGDGLDVQGNLLAAATGHHAPMQGRPQPGDPAYGAGHGIEFFDISDPAKPRHLSRIKFPPFYRIGMDMWGVVLSGDYAFVNDTHNGHFVIDVRDPSSPRCLGWTRLPEVKGGPSPAAGVAVSDAQIFIAGGFDDLHRLPLDAAKRVTPSADAGVQVSAPRPNTFFHGLPAYVVDGAIRTVVPWKEDLLLVAAGSAGWHVVRQTETGFEPVAAYPTEGFARDITFHGDRVFVAESFGGLSVWKAGENGLMKRVSEYRVPKKSVHQVVLVDEGRVAFLAVGANTIHAVTISDDLELKEAMKPEAFLGLFYRDPFSPVAEDGKRFLAQWHVTGLYEYQGEAGKANRGEWHLDQRMGTKSGATPWRGDWLVTTNRGYARVKSGETRPFTEIGVVKVPGVNLEGKPSVHGDTLFVSDPYLGDLTAVDLRDVKSPKVKAQLKLLGHPGRVKVHQNKALIPAGREGLLLWDLN